MRVLVVAVSARMLGELAVADGYEVVALDRFGDVDLRAIAPVTTASSNEALTRRAEGVDADAVVYGAGFENRPELVTRLARGRELLGTPPGALAAVRDPWAVGAAARAAGARAPETRRADEARSRAGGGDAWLRKPRHSGGGRGVRPWTGEVLGPGEVVQRRVRGLPCSVVAIGDGRRATVLGLTEQLLAPGCFQWTGNVTPPRLPEQQRAALEGQLSAVCATVVTRFGVRGAFGIDAVWDGRHAWVLEVNPRPPASLELFEAGTFAAHVHGARGVPVDGSRAPSGQRVKLVLYAPRDVRAPDPAWWPPELVHDIPRSGQFIRLGSPVCTLISAGASTPELAQRGARLLAGLPDAALARA